MYNAHFGLKQAPFRITPDTRLFFSGGGRGDILDALVYAITSGEGIVKVVGEVGSGKTMLCRMLEERLPERVEIVYLANPSLTPDDILQAIALEMNLEVPANANRLQVMHALQHRLVEKHANNRQVVVFIEEAQSMPIETLEEIRLLSNLETNREKLLQIVLFGQPELDDNLDDPNIRQLRERITHSFHLEPFTRQELRDYVNYRMRAVGYRGPDVFRSGAYQSMARASEGLTRRINILADKALLAAFADDRHDVDRKHVRQAIVDSQFERRRRNRAPELMLGLGIVMVIGAVGWTLFGPRPSTPLTDARPALAAAGPVEQSSPAPVTTTRVAAAAEDGADPKASPGGQAEGAGVTAAAPPAAMEQETPEPEGQPLRVAGVEMPDPEKSATSAPSADVVAEPEQPAETPVEEGGTTSAAEAGEATSPSPAPAETADKPAQESSSAGTAVAAKDPADETRPGSGEVGGAAAGIPPEQATNVAAERSAADANAPGALLEQRIEVTRDWLRNTSAHHYSIQLLLTARRHRRNLEDFLERQAKSQRLEQLYVYETVINDRPYIGVLYGEFQTLTAAREALENLPSSLKRFGPFIRNVSDISSVG